MASPSIQNSKERKYKVAFKIIIAFLAAAAVPSVIFACFILIVSPGIQPLETLVEFGAALIFAFGVSAAHILLLGLPAFLLGLRLRMIYWWSCIIVASIIGTIPFAITSWSAQNIEPIDYLRCSFLGASAGLVFWILWRYWVRYEE